MLSYRHSFHAGNFADVVKHFCLVEVLDYMNRKDKAYLYCDTHAGAGIYSLTSREALINEEAKQGFLKLEATKNLVPELTHFVASIREIVPNKNHYPGSPCIAAKLLRTQDTLQASELHPADFPKLEESISNFRQHRSYFHRQDGFKMMLGCLPPPQHRAVILIDPAYENSTEYADVIKAVQKGLRKFPSATLMIWYPLITKYEAQAFGEKLQNIASENYDFERIELSVKKIPESFGMYGTGMIIFNPPYLLPKKVDSVKQQLTSILAQDNHAEMLHQFHIR